MFKDFRSQALNLILEARSVDHLDVAFGARRPAVNLKNPTTGGVKGKKVLTFASTLGRLMATECRLGTQTVGVIV